MFRDNHFNVEHLNILFDNAGMGDYIASMPAVKYLRDHVPNVVPHLWVPDFFLETAKNLVPGIIIKPFSENYKYNPSFAGVKLSNEQHSPMRTHLTDFAFNMFVDKQVDIKYKNYCSLDTSKVNIDKFKLPSKYVILTTGFTAEVREMLPNIANEIIDYCKSKNYEVVLLGNEKANVGHQGKVIRGNFKQNIKKEECINLINLTSLLEAGKIIEQSRCVIGLDNGILHLAGCTDVPIVAGYSTVDPILRNPYRKDILGWNCYNVIPEDSLKCRFCQSSMVHVFNKDFRFCYYKDRKCLYEMTSNKYIKHLENIL